MHGHLNLGSRNVVVFSFCNLLLAFLSGIIQLAAKWNSWGSGSEIYWCRHIFRYFRGISHENYLLTLSFRKVMHNQGFLLTVLRTPRWGFIWSMCFSYRANTLDDGNIFAQEGEIFSLSKNSLPQFIVVFFAIHIPEGNFGEESQKSRKLPDTWEGSKTSKKKATI